VNRSSDSGFNPTRGEGLMEEQSRILESIAKGQPLNETLDKICLAIEKRLGRNALCSIMLLDKKSKTLRFEAGPSFPETLAQALDNVEIAHNAGSCGAAAYSGKPVIVSDVASDPRWHAYRTLAEQYHIQACWSLPIFASSGECLGTFALTHRHKRSPNDYETALLNTGSHLSAIAIERDRIEAALRINQQRYHNIFESVAVPILEEDVSALITALKQLKQEGVTDFAGYFKSHPEFVREAWRSIEVLDANQAALRLHGARSKQELLGPLHRLFVHTPNSLFEQQLLALAEGKTNFKAETVIRDQEGELHDILLSIRLPPLSGDDRFLVSTIDITKRKQIDHQLRQLSRAVELSPVSVIITDNEGCVEYVNPYFLEITGYRMDEVIGLNPRFLKSDETSQATYEAIWRTLATGGVWTGELASRKKNGDLFWEQCFFSPIKAANGTVTHFLAVKEDITQRKEQERQLLHQAHYDALTGLPNRLLALDRLSQALVMANRYQNRSVALLYIGLDRFKNVNDTLGHEFGDKLLVESARRLQSSIHEEDTVARVGSDEFLLILPDLKRADQSEVIAERVLERFTLPFHIDNTELFVSASIGIAVSPEDGEDASVLLRNASAAMYQAKLQGPNASHYFTREMNAHAMERMKIENHLRHAMERNELFLHYQPLVDADNSTLIGAEALLRWDDPHFGMITPDRFIPIAEETGLIIDIGEWVLNTACRQVKKWRSQGHPNLQISVNVSSRQLHTGQFVRTVFEALKRNDLTADALELELTENVLMDDNPDTGSLLNDLDKIGVSLSIDDFGTGYSSLSYLRRFSFKTLKIDRTFINEIGTNPQDASLTKAIIAMAQALNLKVIAEGVENEKQIQLLRSENCDLLQGFYYHKPCSAGEFTAYISHQQPASLQ
jgi:diguanylate cyclase (GGDEF)-like protein/PAS domain S-box-containing protein